MRKLITFLLAAVTAVAAWAQSDDMAWCANAPQKYLPMMTRIIVSRESPCNQGEEAFMDFIPKFRRDETFRKTRIRIPASDEIGTSTAEYYGGWDLVKAKQGRGDGVKYFGTWYDVKADNVCFHFEEWPTSDDAEWGGSAAFLRFQRIDGKWYLTGIQVAG